MDKVKTLILMGQTSNKILGVVQNKIDEKGIKLPIYKVESLEEAIKKAKENARQGQVVLFSPASASFDMFKNFEERGKKFKELVKNI